MRPPKYVTKCMLAGEHAHLEDDTWYVGTRTSERVPGKASPQKIFVPVAIVTYEGRMPLHHEKEVISVGTYSTREFGFSYTLQFLCDPDWKKALQQDWKPIFLSMIKEESPDSYLLLDNPSIVLPENRKVKSWQANFWTHLPSNAKQDLSTLKSLHIVYSPDGRKSIAIPGDHHKSILSKFNVSLEGVNIP